MKEQEIYDAVQKPIGNSLEIVAAVLRPMAETALFIASRPSQSARFRRTRLILGSLLSENKNIATEERSRHGN